MLREHWQTSAPVPSPDAVGTSAIALVTDLSVLTFAGQDVTAFLQGYLTSDLGDLADGDYHLAALTNIQGRVVANGWCHQRDSSTLDWIVHATLADRVAAFMKPYLAFSRTTLEARADDHLVIGLTGARPAPIVVEDAGTLDALLGAHPVVEETRWRKSCIEARIALVTEPVSERFLPQMLGLVEAGAVAFDKGCYLGQEVVARAQHRGEVKRKLHRFRSTERSSGTPLAAGDVLHDESGRESGMVIVAEPGGADSLECLGVVREAADQRYTSSGVTLLRLD